MNVKSIQNSKCIKNIEVTFVDLYNESKVLTIPKSRLSYAIKNGLKFDGSSISKMKNVNQSDMEIYLDLKRQYILPNKNLMIFANTNYSYDARKNLLLLENDLTKKNIKVNIGAEIEFFMFDISLKEVFENNKKSLSKNKIIRTINKKNKKIKYNKIINNYAKSLDCNQVFDNLKYYDYDENRYFNVLNDVTEFCKNTNLIVEQFHHECGTNQFELDFKFSSPTKTADNLIFLKNIITHFAKKHNLYACFLPKPLKKESGSGMHINISAYKNKSNIFYNKKDKFHLSSLAYNFIDGIFNHINSITAVANPIKNSYQRLLAGCECPTKIDCNANDRTSLIRIPSASKNATRIELRSADISCNPYLTFLAVIKSGFEFLLNENWKKDFKKYVKPNKLPKSLSYAKQCLKNDKYLSTIVPQNY